MLQRIKQILLTQYIGAIIVAFIAVQGILGALGILMQPVWWLATRSRKAESIFAVPERAAFDWNSLLAATVNVAIHLLVAYLLFRWLYMNDDSDNPKVGVAIEPLDE